MQIITQLSVFFEHSAHTESYISSNVRAPSLWTNTDKGMSKYLSCHISSKKIGYVLSEWFFFYNFTVIFHLMIQFLYLNTYKPKALFNCLIFVLFIY